VATRSGSLGAGAQERHFGRKSTDWIAAHHAGITLSLRIAVAGLIALAICELLGVRQVYWAVLTALIVIQASVGWIARRPSIGWPAPSCWGAMATIQT
jgi:uncharacterized membrane protein YccC